MKVDPQTTAHRAEHAGTVVYFCCAHCRARFLADPGKYTIPRSPDPMTAPAPALHQRLYTCPMHPEIQEQAPGNCPVCGMALEPVTATAESEPSAELSDMTRRFWIAAVLAGPLVISEMGGQFAGRLLHTHLSTRALQWVEFVLASAVVLWAGWPLLERGWASIRNRSPNMFTLITLGTGAAYADSVLAILAPGLFPAAFMAPDGSVPVYFESAAVITVLVLLGQVMELRARARTGGALRALIKLAPKVAQRIRDDGQDEEAPLDEIRIGDRIRIRPGEAVAVDGQVLEGQSAVDESMVTGESMPLVKEAGSRVIGGTTNGTGSLLVRADQVGAGTLLARIVQMVAAAQRSRAPIQRVADRIAGWFVPTVILIAAAAFAAWMTWGPPPAFAYALAAAVSTLIIACPCALGLATPMAIMVGVGRGAGAGILIRDAEALERLEKVDTLVVDKTGTLSEGKPRVVGIVAAEGFDEATLLRAAASLERSSEHPLAAAIIAASRERGGSLEPATDFHSHTGQGVTGTIAGCPVVVGSAKLLAQLGVSIAPWEERAEQLRRDGATVVFVAIAARIAGIIAVADPIKPTTPSAIERLRAEGVRIVMLTGDNRTTAEAVARKLGIREIEADVLPQQKNAVVRRLRAEGRIVAMAGDGVNDAPALAAADVGLAMGTGTDVAIKAAGVVLVKGDLSGIARARALSRATMRNIRQNLALAFVYNILGIPLAAGALYPAFGLVLSPMIAAAAMSLSSVSVITNSLRLRFARL
jgi:Cu+-exporting ATPase